MKIDFKGRAFVRGFVEKNIEEVPLCWGFVYIRKPSFDSIGSEDMRVGSFPMAYMSRAVVNQDR